MDVVIHNAEEAVKACGIDLPWVSDSVAQMITDFDALLDVPPDHVVERVIEETVWKIEEVPCGWCIFWGHPELVKNIRETGKPGDVPMICERIGAGFLSSIAGRARLKPSTSGVFLLGTPQLKTIFTIFPKISALLVACRSSAV